MNQEGMNLREKIDSVFVNAVTQLMEYRNSMGGKIYAVSNNGHYLNFKTSDFKTAVNNQIGESEENTNYLRAFRRFKYIITEKDLFSTTQKIKNKTRRVITVDKDMLDAVVAIRRGEWI